MSSRYRIGVLAVLGMGIPAWYSPVSPVALQLADAHIASASFESSFQRYTDIVTRHWSAEVRAKALRRAALLHQLEGQAVDELNLLLDLAEGPEQVALVQAQIGMFYLRNNAPSKAATWLDQAQQTAPEAVEAGQRLMASARAHEEAGQTVKAEKAYERLAKQYKELGAQADVGLAELMLASGKARSAKRFFERAARRAQSEDVRVLAQFGVATCLERMGELEEALAEMDELDLPSRMLDERRDGIRAHQVSEDGGM